MMDGQWMVGFEMMRVMRIFVRQPPRIVGDHGLEPGKKGVPAYRPEVGPRAIFFDRALAQAPSSGHLGDLKSKDFSSPRFNRNRDTEGLALGLFAGLEIIELHEADGFPFESSQELVLRNPGPSSHEPHFPGDGVSSDLEQDRSAALRYAGIQEFADLKVELSLFLPVSGKASGR